MILLKFLIAIYLVQYSRAFTFNEELLVENLPDSHVHLHFKFSTIWENDKNNKDKSVKNYELFPKRLGDIVSTFKMDQLKLTLSQGTWKYDKWGMPSLSAPSGSELWAIFENGLSEKIVDENWLQSSRTISGLFGLSINLKDNPNTVKPKYLNLAIGNSSSLDANNLRYVSVPNEIICTENLTPWIKLLPCGRNKGVAQLFKNIQKLFEAQYLLAGLDYDKKCMDPNCLKEKIEFTQTISLVYDLNLLNVKKTEDEVVWSFSTVLSSKIDSACPVADSSNIYLDLGNNISPTTQFTKKVKYSKEKSVFVYDLKSVLKDQTDFNPLIISKRKTEQLNNKLTSVHRYITNSNERNFGLKIIITNLHDKKLSIVYFDTIPWYFRVYINSLEITSNNGTLIEPDMMHFSPGLDRKRPNHLELVLDIKPKSIISIHFTVEYAYLKWDEFPPDVNHGFHINPAIVSIRLPAHDRSGEQLRMFNIFSNFNDLLDFKIIDQVQSKLVNVYTETLLMNLPVPDFSMPYNVICLTCTAIAIVFGSIHNFTTRKFVFIEPKTFKEKIFGIFKKFCK